MLILLSDIHLTDGSTAINVVPDAFALLLDDIKQTAKRRKATEIHLVLLGDILDFVRTDYWHVHIPQKEHRPWNGDLDPATGMNAEVAAVERQFQEVLRGILETGAAKAFLGMIEQLFKLPNDVASLHGNEPVRVTYVVGNHDRVLHNFPSLKQAVRDVIPSVKFQTMVEEAPYGVRARHGHEWDENNHGWAFFNEVLRRKKEPKQERFEPKTYQVMTIGEVVTAELMGGFIHHVKESHPGNDPAYDQLVQRLKDLNNLRPMLHVFQWLDWLGSTRGYYSTLHDALKKALDGTLDTELARRWDHLKRDFLVSGDLVDRLQFVRSRVIGKNFSQFKSNVQQGSAVLNVVDGLIGDRDELLEGAGEEFETMARGSRIQYIVYGHTHRARHDVFTGQPGGDVRMYINTGTYLPLITRTRDGRNFAMSKQMTLTYFYHEGEDTENKREGPSVDIWQGIRRKHYRDG